MKNHKKVLFLLNVLLVFIGISFLVSLYQRLISIDDAWIGEWAYWLAKLGYVKSELFRGYEGHEHQLLVYHKLFTLHGGLLVRVFGWNAYLLKSVSLGYLFVILWGANLIMKRCRIPTAIWYRVFLILFLFNPITFRAAFRFRPEIMLSALGVLSYYSLDKGIHAAKPWYIGLAGFWAGGALCTHLNGVMYVMAGAVILILARHLRNVVIFGMGVFVGFLPYFYDMTTVPGLTLWVRQFRHSPAFYPEDFWIVGYFFKLLKEVDRFFHSPKECLFTFMLLIIGYWSFRYLKTRYSQLSLYTCCLVIGLGTFANTKTVKYMLVHLPFLCILATIGLHYLYTQAKSIPTYVRQYLLPVVIGIYIIGSSIIILMSIPYNWNSVAAYQSLAQHIPTGAKVFAPLPFIYNEIERYSIQGLTVYDTMQKRGMLAADTTPFQFAEQFGNEYLIVDKEHITAWQLHEITDFGNYELMHKKVFAEEEKVFWVFKKKRKGNSL